MHHREVRARLEAVISDIDAGRLRLPYTHALGRRVSGPILVAALGLAAGATHGCKSSSDDTSKTTATPTVDEGEPVDVYGVPVPPQPEPAPQPAYLAPVVTASSSDAGPPDANSAVPRAAPEYMAVEP